jgi:hypothetical protein
VDPKFSALLSVLLLAWFLEFNSFYTNFVMGSGDSCLIPGGGLIMRFCVLLRTEGLLGAVSRILELYITALSG